MLSFCAGAHPCLSKLNVSLKYGGVCLAGCHVVAQTQGYHLVCIWGSLVKFQGGGIVVNFDVFCTLMQFVCTVCMQAMAPSVENVPSQHAVELLVLGLGFVEQCWLRLFLGHQLQLKMG